MAVAPITTRHSLVVQAPPRAMYELVADTEGAPRYAPSQVHAHVLKRGAGEDLVKRWVHAAGKVRSWVFRRRLDPGALRIEFEHEAPQAPVLSQRGVWTFAAEPGGGTLVEVVHTLELDDDGAAAGLVAMLDQNVPMQLAMYQQAGEMGGDLARLMIEAEDAVILPGTVAQRRAQLQDEEGDDRLRIPLPDERLLVKWLTPPEHLLTWLGVWSVAEAGPDTVEVRFTQRATLRASALGPGLEPARAAAVAGLEEHARRSLDAIA